MLSLISFMFTFSVTEHLLLRYGVGLDGPDLLQETPGIQKDLLNGVYLVLSSVVSSLAWFLFTAVVYLPFLMIPVYILLAFLLPRGIMMIFQAWIPGAEEWFTHRHYSLSAAVILMYVLTTKGLNPLLALIAALVATISHTLVRRLFIRSLQRLAYEQLPRFLRPLPLAFVILGIFGLVFAGLEAVLADAPVAFFKSL